LFRVAEAANYVHQTSKGVVRWHSQRSGQNIRTSEHQDIRTGDIDMKTNISPTQRHFGIQSLTLRSSLRAIALAAFIAPAMPLFAAGMDDGLPSSSRLKTSTELAAAQEASKVPQRSGLDVSGKPVCAELRKTAQLPAPATGITGVFTGVVGCGTYGVYADAAPGADAGALGVDVATEVVWHIQWRAWFAYVDQPALPRLFTIAAQAPW
jgi:hypothetical protein